MCLDCKIDTCSCVPRRIFPVSSAKLSPHPLQDEHVQTILKQDASYLSFLSSSSPSGQTDLPAATRLNLPLWVITPLFRADIVDLISLPSCYGRKFREKLKANGGQMLNLRAKGNWYYEVGGCLCDLIQVKGSSRRSQNMASLVAEAARLREVLKNTYSGPRMRLTLDWSFHSVGQDVSGFLAGLPAVEARLFSRGSRATKDQEEWRKGEGGKIRASEVIIKSEAISLAHQKMRDEERMEDRGKRQHVVTPEMDGGKRLRMS